MFRLNFRDRMRRFICPDAQGAVHLIIDDHLAQLIPKTGQGWDLFWFIHGIRTIKLDLEARGVIGRIPKSRPRRICLAGE